MVDADAIVRDVQRPGSPVLDAIAREFGVEMLNADGALDRAALGETVFGTPDAVARLNAIVHPAVRAESQRRFEDALSAAPDAVVVYDVPLLAEARVNDPWDLIVVAHAPAAIRVERLVRLRGLSADAAQARLASQASDDARLRLADVVIDTSGALEHTLAQTDELWDSLADRVAQRARRP